MGKKTPTKKLGLNFGNIKNLIEIPSVDIAGIFRSQAKSRAQPHITNNLLEDLISSQMPKWFHYLSLGLIAFTLIISIVALLHSYNII